MKKITFILVLIGIISALFASTMTVHTSSGAHEFELNEITSITFETTENPPENMVFVEGGTFVMGDRFNEGQADELPLHEVTVNSFYIGKYEVTQAEYQSVMGENPSHFVGENNPVEGISWYDAILYCNALSLQDGLTPCYDPSDWSCDFNANGYRLPTEAEWEYAARGGVNEVDNLRYSGCHLEFDLPGYAWYVSNSDSQTHEVGTREPNQLGIYDMSGNASELCNDWYDSEYYDNSPIDNPRGPESGSLRVKRGGNHSFVASCARVGNRYFDSPSTTSNDMGFRIIRAIR